MRVRREKRSFDNRSVPKLEFGNEKAKSARGLEQLKTFRELRSRFEPAPAFGLRQSSAAFCAGITQQGDLKVGPSRTHPLFPAEKFTERLKEFGDRFRDRFDALRKLGRFAAMNGTGLGRNFISGQNDFVRGTRHLTSGGGQRVRSRANGYPR